MRKVLDFNLGWEYSEVFHPEFITEGLGNVKTTSVNLPHTNKELPYNYFDEKDYQFISSYGKSFELSKDYAKQRVFLDFGGVMAYAEVYLNGALVGTHKGGYTPFSCDLTDDLRFGGENALLVKVDSTERDDIPPFGNVIDYLCYGGIYREVHLRIVDPVFIENVFARPKNVLADKKGLDTTVFLKNHSAETEQIEILLSLNDGDQEIVSTAHTALTAPNSETAVELSLTEITGLKLWCINSPNLYELRVSLKRDDQFFDRFETRIGFREAVVTENGFYLNGEPLKIRGLNRHQAWPYVGYAMPARVQKRDADILKYELNLNTVRTSHYPQSTHFLDRCDEIGLLVIEEIPGWQYIGDDNWKEVAYDDVRSMITRDWNRPAIFLWGVRINESPDDHTFYTETNRIARQLDPTRQTGGIRCHPGSEFLEDVYTMNDFVHSGGEPVLRDQKTVTQLDHHVPYLVTEYNGHMYPTKRFDQEERLMEHALRHLRVLNAAGLDRQISGTVGWCAFDYNTHFQFGSGDRICYHGVMDMFRIPKFAAGAYRSQVDPKQDLVLEPVTLWARGERSIGGVIPLVIFTNCDSLEIRVGGRSLGRFHPSKEMFSGVAYPPVVIDEIPQAFGEWGSHWKDGEFIGYINGKEVIRRNFVKDPVPTVLEIKADDHKLNADGQDATRITFRILDQAGNLLPYINDFVKIKIEGPAKVIGPQEVSLIGGCIATWIKTGETPGIVKVSGESTRLTSKVIEIEVL